MEENEEKRQSTSLFGWLPRPKIKSNGLKRTITGLSLITYFIVVVYYGLPMMLLQALIIQMKCFDEIINIAYNMKKMPDIPYFRTLNWYFVITANYFFFGETFAEHLEVYVKKYYIFQVLVTYHRFLSFCWYFIGIIWFLTLVRKRIIRHQFSLLAWTHFLLIIICLQTYMIVQNIFEGLIWLIIPLWLVILNDIFAYVFGRLLGKTPLISLSPKKTVEGFIFGGIFTFIFGSFSSYVFCLMPYLTCPIKFMETENGIIMNTNCTPSYLFELIQFNIVNTGISVKTYPFILHSLAFSFFASVIAPFGGFCASGFKRAFQDKRFR
ncbi:hypothetical protein NQ314_015363 [Rhamnusium bicolor]|uniref:phosphatidate cytidylyltransferase n=1 Tax=Rhamnusium bicolor TaxID=1586634 RepID=A0AAV8WZL6_9CUCU|nr:hypothetical protein NQ314_015363 [Rhamnusium bicolor]